MQGAAEIAEVPNPAHLIQVPPLTFLPPCTSYFLSANVGSRFGFGGLDAVATKQVAREDHSTAKTKVTSAKHMQRRKPAAPATGPSTPPLISPPRNGIRSAPPSGEELQRPSPVNCELELELEFLSKMVLEMQEGAARKARRMVIGRTLNGRPMIQAFQDCFKLHFTTSFKSATLLTRGFLEVLFIDEEGAKVTRKITMVELNDLNLSFFRYIPNFDSSAQDVETLLSHTIKIQFLDLHEQFRNVKALPIMASKIGDVLKIESTDLYMKRSISPMITMETHDISKLAGYIRIPSMAKGANAKDTTPQRILYSGLPNQC